MVACRDDGIGKRILSLCPTAKPAGDTATISSLSPFLCLSRSLTSSVFCSFPVFSHFRVYFFHLFFTSLLIFSLLSPLLELALLMLSCHISYQSFFVFIFTPVALCFLVVSWVFSFLITNSAPSITDKECVKLELVDLILKYKTVPEVCSKICQFQTLCVEFSLVDRRQNSVGIFG